MNENNNTGQHILAELWQCQCDPTFLSSREPLLTHLIDAISDSGLTLVGQVVHEFGALASLATDMTTTFTTKTHRTPQTQINGITLTLLLAESHLCLHTWGEHQTVTLDVYVCNVTQDNSLKAQALFKSCLELFQPQRHHVNTVQRQHYL